MRNMLASLRYFLGTCGQEYASPKASRGRGSPYGLRPHQPLDPFSNAKGQGSKDKRFECKHGFIG